MLPAFGHAIAGLSSPNGDHESRLATVLLSRILRRDHGHSVDLGSPEGRVVVCKGQRLHPYAAKTRHRLSPERPRAAEHEPLTVRRRQLLEGVLLSPDNCRHGLAKQSIEYRVKGCGVHQKVLPPCMMQVGR